jgi:hypothetical protein
MNRSGAIFFLVTPLRGSRYAWQNGAIAVQVAAHEPRGRRR